MRAPDWRPDYVHYFRDFLPESAWLGYRRALPQWLRSSSAIAFVASLIDEQLEVDLLMTHVANDLDYDESIPEAEANARFTRNLRTLGAVARSAGARILYSTFQFRDGDDAIGRSVNQALRDFFRASDVDWVDQDALIADDDPTLQWDDCHFTRKGRELMADNFFDYIVDHELLAPRSVRGVGAPSSQTPGNDRIE